jgi:hypothetical protein
LRVAAVRLDASRSDSQAAHQRRRNYSNLVPALDRSVRDSERFRAALQDHPTRGLPTQELRQTERGDLAFVQDLAVRGPNTNLRFLPAEIDRNMLHGCLLELRR